MDDTSQPDRRDDDKSTTHQASDRSDEMAKADVANGERPEQPESKQHSRYERDSTDDERTGAASNAPDTAERSGDCSVVRKRETGPGLAPGPRCVVEPTN
jgi:hypothetical protein